MILYRQKFRQINHLVIHLEMIQAFGDFFQKSVPQHLLPFWFLAKYLRFPALI